VRSEVKINKPLEVGGLIHIKHQKKGVYLILGISPGEQEDHLRLLLDREWRDYDLIDPSRARKYYFRPTDKKIEVLS
jgi:ribonucleotide reductase alpha subunit